MKQLWTYVALGLICGLAACSFADERVPSSPDGQGSPAAATTIADAPAIAPTIANQPAQPTPTFVPTGDGAAAPNPGGSSARSILLEDPDWQGGYRRASGDNTYGGRSAAWIYGSSTQFSTMRASFELAEQPGGTAALSIEGMDSEGAAKTPIQISINGTAIFNGPNPLPDDDLPLDSGTWSSYTWRFDAALLRPGTNSITISNLAPGAFSRPPFFMLDYARISF
jgi:hypothetical protein